MALNLTKRPFWYGTPRAVRLGDMLMRYSSTDVPVDEGSVNAAHVNRRMGKTSFGLVGNRVPWMGRDTKGALVLMLSRRASAAVNLPLDGDAFYVEHFSSYNDEASYASTQRMAIRSRSRYLIGGFQSGTAYLGQVRTAYAPTGQGNSTFVSGYSDTIALGQIPKAVPGYNLEISTYDKSTGQGTSNRKYHISGVAGDVAFVAKDTGISEQTDVLSVHPEASTVRNRLGLPHDLDVGFIEFPHGIRPTLLAGGYVHGIHSAVKAIVLDDAAADTEVTVDAKYIYAVFTRDNCVDIINGQKQFADTNVRVQMEQFVAELLKMDVRTNFNLLICKTPVGNIDVYTAKQVQAALNDGADISDVDKTIVSGKRADVWRAECKAIGPVKSLLWMDKAGGMGVKFPTISGSANVSDVSLYPAPLSGDKIGLTTTSINASINANGTGVTVGDFVAQLEAKYGIEIALDMDLAQVDLARDTATMEPWNDMGLIWWQRCGSRQLQPLANCLTGALLETVDRFVI